MYTVKAVYDTYMVRIVLTMHRCSMCNLYRNYGFKDQIFFMYKVSLFLHMFISLYIYLLSTRMKIKISVS